LIVNAEIREALRQLGYAVGFEMEGPEPDIAPIGRDRYRVGLNGEYFGIWDSNKRTFVD